MYGNCRKTNDWWIAQTLDDLGNVYCKLGQNEDAIDYNKKNHEMKENLYEKVDHSFDQLLIH